MWPFPRRPKLELPPWEFQPATADMLLVQLSCGAWLVTDGAHRQDSMPMGEVSASAGTLRTGRGEAGVEWFELTYTARPCPLEDAADFVIDSGVFVLFADDIFVQAGIVDRRSAEALLRTAYHACPHVGTMLVLAPEQICVAIIVFPAFGDGAYRVAFSEVAELRTLRLDMNSR